MTLFNLDNPVDGQLGTLTRFSGWYIHPTTQKIRLSLYLNGQPYASLLHGLERLDVAAGFPEQEGALSSGFFGDILIPSTIKLGEGVEIEIFCDGKDKTLLFHKKFTVVEVGESWQQKPKSFDIEQLLYCPECRQKIILSQLDSRCTVCNRTVYTRGGTPHILPKDELPFLRMTEKQSTHPYSQDVMAILDKVGDGIVLDFGAGNTPEEYLRPNVCYLEAQQYLNTDIVCTTSRLPFANNSFDAVISQAVFEHIPNPFFTASELYRILKPGGIIHIDTAFMQPLHGDPSHYFNMTLHALRLVLSDFQELRSGIKPYQYPSFGFIMQIEAVMPYLAQGKWKNRLENLHQVLLKEGSELDAALGEKGRQILAAGVFFEGQK